MSLKYFCSFTDHLHFFVYLPIIYRLTDLNLSFPYLKILWNARLLIFLKQSLRYCIKFKCFPEYMDIPLLYPKTTTLKWAFDFFKIQRRIINFSPDAKIMNT